MARPLHIKHPDAVYRVTSRGNTGADILVSDAERQIFLDVLAATVEKCNWTCHAICLLDNHYHAVIETPDPNLSLGMRQLNGVCPVFLIPYPNENVKEHQQTQEEYHG